LLAAILGNPTMIEAYKAGIPGNGKPFPDGSKMAKVHWNPKKNDAQPGQPLQPATQHDVDFMVKDSKRFADSGGWDGARSSTMWRLLRSNPPTRLPIRPRGTTRSADLRATRS
jgi:cytochrome P460